MEHRQAIDVALDVYKQPLLARHLSSQKLPQGMLVVIQLAAGKKLSDKSAYSDEYLQKAAHFFLQNVLSNRNTDHYRQLGLNRGAKLDSVHEHRRWLLKWLHPDRNHNKWESNLFHRVNAAAAAIESSTLSSAKNLEVQLGKPHRKAIKKLRYQFRQNSPLSRSKLFFFIAVRALATIFLVWFGYLGISGLSRLQDLQVFANFWQVRGP